jgi:DNA-binding transcriptional LysR family regulator
LTQEIEGFGVPVPVNIDIDLLRTFVTIVETGSFTRAAEHLLRTQSTVSLQIKRLEEQVRCLVFERNARIVRLTPDGEILLGYARQMLRTNDELLARLIEPEIDGVVRLGTPEDFATTHLPVVLSRFARANPHVALEVTCDLTLNLLAQFEAGGFDVVLVKREPTAAPDGRSVWREPLVWAGSDISLLERSGPLPLIASPAPCVYRKRATQALDTIGRSWRIAYTSPSLAGAQAAVLAGLGIAAIPKAMVRPGMQILGPALGLPDLADTEIALLVSPAAASRAAQRLADHIVAALERPTEDSLAA